MSRLTVFVGFLLFAAGGQVWAACTANTRINQSTIISSLFSGNTICGTGVGDNAGDQWQEWHQSGGTLTEYAKGTDDPVDPTHDVGSWNTTGQGVNAFVNYNYGSGGSYSFNVHDNDDGSYSFCNGPSEVAFATIMGGQASCGF